MTELYYCRCRCGCGVVIASGITCSYCSDVNIHGVSKINPKTVIK